MDGFGLGLDFGMDLFMDGSEGIDKVVPNRNFIFSLSDILMFVLFFWMVWKKLNCLLTQNLINT